MFDLFSDPVKVAQQLEIITSEFGFATWETLYSLVLEVVFAYLIGLPVGVLLVTGEKDGIRPLPGWFMKLINVIINLLRSVPFLILMIIVLPLSKIIVGTKVGTAATIPPMVIAAFPLVARMVESSLREVNHGVIEAAQSMGASTWQTIRYFLLPEAKSSIILAMTTACVGLIGATAMAGVIGGGGVGDLAVSYGYQQFDTVAMIATVIILIIVVQGIQSLGNWLAARSRY